MGISLKFQFYVKKPIEQSLLKSKLFPQIFLIYLFPLMRYNDLPGLDIIVFMTTKIFLFCLSVFAKEHQPTIFMINIAAHIGLLRVSA